MTAAIPESAEPGFARMLAAELARLPDAASYTHDLIVARHCLLDWLGCTIAGSREPVSEAVLGALAPLDGGTTERPGTATVLGTGSSLSPRDAALANGVAAHALDFDDGHPWMNGHPSVAIVSAAAALAEDRKIDGVGFLAAVVAGVHAASVLGLALGQEHYLAGWHPTGTVGAIGAAAACASVLQLDEQTTAQALGIASSQSTGMKAVFGSMGKPLNAGVAATAGVLAALLARNGLTVPIDVIEARQGQAHVQAAAWDPARATETLREGSAMSRVGFKMHACCGATHPTIEALKAVEAQGDHSLSDVTAVDLHVSKQVLDMCRYADPQTGLQGKFSLPHAAALVLAGRPTTTPSFTDAVVREESLRSLRARVHVHGDRGDRGMGTEVRVRFSDGRAVSRTADSNSGRPVDLDAQWTLLAGKFRSLVAPVLGAHRADDLVSVVAQVGDLEDIGAVLRSGRC